MSENLEWLVDLPSEECRFERGAYLFHGEDEVRHYHRLTDGEVHLMRYGENGEVAVMQRARDGDLLAEASIFSACYHCSALAIMPVTTMRYRKSDVLGMLENKPEAAMRLARYLGSEVLRLRKRCEILSLRRVGERIDAFLAHEPLPPRGRWTALADDLGVTREALYRELAKRSD